MAKYGINKSHLVILAGMDKMSTLWQLNNEQLPKSVMVNNKILQWNAALRMH